MSNTAKSRGKIVIRRLPKPKKKKLHFHPMNATLFERQADDSYEKVLSINGDSPREVARLLRESTHLIPEDLHIKSLGETFF